MSDRSSKILTLADIDEFRNMIEQGRVDEVLVRIEALKLKKAVTSRALLAEITPVLRRVGAYDEALTLLSHFDERTPQRALEEALLLGELGAVSSALAALQKIPPSAVPENIRFDVGFHIGNFQSLKRDFAASSKSFSALLKYSGLTNLQLGIAKLNFLGAEIYALNPDASILSQLKCLSEEMKANSFFALEQGCYYFLAYAHHWAGRDREAADALNAANALRLKHRLRETLMLEILGHQVGVPTKSLAEVPSEILNQAHAIYWDQINFIEASKSSIAKLLFHGVDNIYFHTANEQFAASSTSAYQVLSSRGPETLGSHQIRRLKESLSFPALQTSTEQISLTAICSEQSVMILDTLLRRQEFGIREAELWELVWKTSFTSSSADAIRKAIDRIKKQPELISAVEIKIERKRYYASVVSGSKIIFQKSSTR